MNHIRGDITSKKLINTGDVTHKDNNSIFMQRGKYLSILTVEFLSHAKQKERAIC
jgi:hypothetical protein